MAKEGFVVSPKSVLEPTPSYVGEGIFNLDGVLESALARWLNFSVAPCTRKRVRSMIGKLSWLARPSPFLSPFVSGA